MHTKNKSKELLEFISLTFRPILCRQFKLELRNLYIKTASELESQNHIWKQLPSPHTHFSLSIIVISVTLIFFKLIRVWVLIAVVIYSR